MRTRRRYTNDAEEELLRSEGVTRDAIRRTPIKADPIVSGAVYFLEAAGANLVKIGWVQSAQNIERRLDVIRTACPYPVTLRLVVPGIQRSDEARLHKRFEAYWFHGEWFKCEGALKAFLQLAIADGVEAAKALRTSLCLQGD